MISLALGPGIAPDVAIVDDLVYVAFGANPDALMLVVLTQDGAEVKRLTLPHGFDQSFPRFSGPWLVYRQDESRGYAATAWNIRTGQSRIFTPAGATFGLTVNAALDLAAYEWKTTDTPWLIRFGRLSSGDSWVSDLQGAPDGLDAIISPNSVTLRKDTRGDVPSIWYPSRAGHLTVGELRDAPGRPGGGIGVQLDGDLLRVALPAQNTTNPRCAVAGDTHALVCWGQTVRLLLASKADLRALPPAERVAGPVVHLPPVPRLAPIPITAPSLAPIPSTPFPPAHPLAGGSMKVFLRLAGHYVGVDPTNPHAVYHDRVKGGSWEEVSLEPRGDGSFLATFVAANRALSIQPDGSLQTRPAGTDGSYEVVFCTTQPDGLNILYRKDGDTLLGVPLTIEEVA